MVDPRLLETPNGCCWLPLIRMLRSPLMRLARRLSAATGALIDGVAPAVGRILFLQHTLDAVLLHLSTTKLPWCCGCADVLFVKVVFPHGATLGYV